MGYNRYSDCISIRVPIEVPRDIRVGGWIGIQPTEDLAERWGVPQTTSPFHPNFAGVELPEGVSGRLEGASDTHSLRLNVTRGSLRRGQSASIVFTHLTDSSSGKCVGEVPGSISFYLRFVPDLYTFAPGGDSENWRVACRHFDVERADEDGVLLARCSPEDLREEPGHNGTPQFGTPYDPPRVNSVFYFSQGGPYTQDWPTHEACELVSVHEGTAHLAVGGAEHRLEPGSILLVKPFRKHHTRISKGGVLKGINLNFSPGSLLPDIMRLDDVASDEDGDATRVAALLVDILDETRHFLAGAHNCADAYLSLALVELLRLDSEDKRQASEAPADSATRLRIDQCAQLIREQYAENLTLETLAEQLAVSPYHLSHSFSEHTGTTISAYITSVRMRRAAALLTTTSGPLREVASAVGYSDEFYFSKVFKRHFGMPPGTYRRTNTV